REVRLAQAGTHAGEDLVFQTMPQPLHDLTQDARPATALVAHHLVALNADKRRDITQPAQPPGHAVRYELPVGEDLEVTVRVGFENVQELGMHERLAADDAEKGVAHALGLANQAMHGVRL